MGVHLLFAILTNQSEAQIRFIELTATLAGKKENIIHKKSFKTNFYMHNTKGDVVLMNISREKKDISMILCSIQNKVLRLFLNLSMFLECSY